MSSKSNRNIEPGAEPARFPMRDGGRTGQASMIANVEVMRMRRNPLVRDQRLTAVL